MSKPGSVLREFSSVLRPGYSQDRFLKEREGIQTWELRGPAGHHLLKIGPSEKTGFRNEFEFLKSLGHPNFPQALELKTHQGMEFYFREFSPGEALTHYFGSCSAEEVGRLTAEICRALAALHFRGLVHGDLNGNNVIASPQGKICLIDFEFLAPKHEKTPAIRGTPLTMAPELFWGGAPTIQIDLYALGCILYGLIAGHYPFGSESLQDLLRQHALDLPPDPTTLRANFPRALGLLTLRLLAKEPGHRMAEADDVIGEINQILSLDESLEPPLPKTTRKQQKQVAKSFSLQTQAIQFLQKQKTLSAKEHHILAEFLLKAGKLQELELRLPQLAEEEQWLYRGLLFNREGKYEAALQHFMVNEPVRGTRATVALATALHYAGHVEEALQTLEEAEGSLQESPRGRVVLANHKGNLFLFERRLSEAEHAFGRAMEGARQAGAVDLEALTLMNLANVQVAQSLWGIALENYTRAWEIFKGLGQEPDEIKVQLNLAGLLRFSGHLERSHALIEEALARLQDSNPQLLAYAFLLRADLEKKEGKFEKAVFDLRRAEEILQKYPSASDRGDLIMARAEISFALFEAKTLWITLEEAHRHALASKDSLLEERIKFLKTMLEALQTENFNVEKIVNQAESLCREGDTEFILDNLKRAKLKAQDLNLTWPGELLDWAHRKIQKVLDFLPKDYHAFFQNFYQEFSEKKIMKETTQTTSAKTESSADLQLKNLLEWMRELTGELNLNDLTGKILHRMLEFTTMERGFLIIKENERLIVMQSHHMQPGEFKEGVDQLSWSLTRQAVDRQEALFTTDARKDARLSAAQSVSALELRAILVLPFRYQGRVLGAVYLDSRLQAPHLQAKDLPYLMGLGDILGIAIHNASRFERTEQDLWATRKALAKSQEELQIKFQYENIIGRAPGTREFLQKVDKVTEVQVPVLLLGESGVGKELVAKAIHYNGPLQKGPFVATNCTAIPESLVESELFGHERGAFTGALQSREGLFEQAHHGTLFLDEIGDMPLNVQAKLLRVLQDGEVRRVGAEQVRQVQVRILAATHRDLKEEIKRGKFREDLFYRLSVAEIRIPPLMDRREDIPLLVNYFLQKFSDQNRIKKRKMDAQCLNFLMGYDWPGNIRELENLIYNLCIFSSGATIQLADLQQKPEFQKFMEHLPSPAKNLSSGAHPMLSEAIDRGEISLSEAKRRFEKEEILRVLELHERKVGEAARHLGIPRPQLSRLLKYHHLPSPFRNRQ